jgi:hypothetical protein
MPEEAARVKYDLAVHKSNGLLSAEPDGTDRNRAVAKQPVSDRSLPHPRLSAPLSIPGSQPS